MMESVELAASPKAESPSSSSSSLCATHEYHQPLGPRAYRQTTHAAAAYLREIRPMARRQKALIVVVDGGGRVYRWISLLLRIRRHCVRVA